MGRARRYLLRGNVKNPDKPCGLSGFYPGDDLVSHAVARAVPSALRGLTSVFGMGTGVTLSVRSPKTCEVLDNSILMGKPSALIFLGAGPTGCAGPPAS